MNLSGFLKDMNLSGFLKDMNRPGFVFGSAGTLLAAALIVWGLWPDPEYVEIAQITEGQFEETVDEDGVTRIKDIYTVSAPVAGRLLRSSLKPGEWVQKAKTVLARIQPVEPAFLDISNLRSARASVESARAAINLAQSNIVQARERLRFAQDEYKRARREKRKGRIKKAQVERVRFDRNLAREAVNIAKTKLAIAKEDLKIAEARLVRPGMVEPSTRDVRSGAADETVTKDAVTDKAEVKKGKKAQSGTKKNDAKKGTAKSGGPTAGSEDASLPEKDLEPRIYKVLSPIDGQVLTILQGNAQTVPAGTPIMRLGNPGELEIVVDLLSRDAVRVRPGAKAYIEQWGGEDTLHAEVVSVEPTGFAKVSALGIVEQRVKAVLDLKDAREKWQRLGDGFQLQVRIVVWSSDKIINVPVSALFRRGDGWAVFKIKEGRAQLTPIEIGHRNRRHAEVKKGLSSGDRVILYPSDRINDDVRVADRKDQGGG